MNENLHDIEDLFHDAIEAHGEAPPDYIWNNIDRKLDQNSFIDTQLKYKRLKRLSFVLVVFLVAVVVFEWQKKPYALHTTAPGTAIEKDSQNNGRAEVASSGINKASKNNPIEALVDNHHASGRSPMRTDSAFANAHDKLVAPAISSRTVQHAAGQLQPPPYKNTSSPPEETTPASSRWNKRYNKTQLKIALTKTVNSSSYITKGKPAIGLTAWAGHNNGTENKQSKTATSKRSTYPDAFALREVSSSPGQHTSTPMQITEESRLPAPVVIQPSGQMKPFMVNISDATLTPGLLLSPNRSTVTIVNPKRSLHFSLTPYFAPLFYFDNIADGDQHAQNGTRGNDAEHIKHAENEVSAFSLGLNIQVQVGKRWTLQSGIAYQIRNEQIDGKKIYASPVSNGAAKYRLDFSSGYVYVLPANSNAPALGDSIMTSRSSSKLSYLAIPLAIGYTFGNGKFNIIPSVGASINVLVHDNLQTSLISGSSIEKQDITSVEGLKKAYVQSLTGISFQYNIHKRISLSVTPSVSFALGSINNNGTVKSYPNVFSVAAGLRYYF